MTDRTDIAARLRERAGRAGVLANDGTPMLYGDADAALDREAADALSRPVTVTEEMVERGARVLADAIGEPVYTAETADVVRHILTAALGGPSAGPETYPGHDPAAGLPQPDTAGGAVTPAMKDMVAAKLRSYGVENGSYDLAHDLLAEVGKQWNYNGKPLAADREASIRAEATAKERERCAGDAFKAALFSYLFNQCAYSYGSSVSEPSPAEFGISWSWQQSKPGVPRMIDQLAEDALQYFERYINEMDSGDEPTDWDREVMRHAAAIRGGGND